MPLHAAVDREAVERPEAVALVALDASGRGTSLTFREVRDLSLRLASVLAEEGVARGDRVAVVLPQHHVAPLVHLACSRLGAVSTPLSALFGPDGLASRLLDARPKIVLTHAPKAGVVREALLLARLDAPVRLVDERFEARVRAAAPLSGGAPAAEDDPMFLVYTSGTTGGPKGALLPHRVLPGRMPGFLLAHEPFAPRERPTTFWSPADWSWIGGLLDALFAPWERGATVVAEERARGFDPAGALALVAEHGVTNAFLPPTALKALARSGLRPRRRLRVVHSAGEPLAPSVAAWASRYLAEQVTEVYGLTEAAFLVGSATRAYATPEGAMGRPYPGHRVVLDDGEICVAAGDPTLMLGYWRGEGRPPHVPLDAQGLLRTGDLAELLDDGSLRFLGRKDDLIKTSGYRVGPAEVEASLLAHPAVAEAAVVGAPDAERGQVVKAFVKVAPGHAAGEKLEREVREFVRARLAAHAYPRVIEFVDALPTTVTGKLKRRELRI